MSTVVKRVTWSLEIRLLDKSHVCRLGHDNCLSSNKGRYSAAAFFHQKDVLHKTHKNEYSCDIMTIDVLFNIKYNNAYLKSIMIFIGISFSFADFLMFYNYEWHNSITINILFLVYFFFNKEYCRHLEMHRKEFPAHVANYKY